MLENKAIGSDIPHVEPGVLVPLSAAQQHVWFSARVNPDSPEDSVFEVRAFRHMPSRQRVNDAVRTLIGRHDAFRVRVVDVDGIPMQEDGGTVELPVDWIDLSGLEAGAAEAEAVRVATTAAITPFRVDTAPLFRAIGIQLPGGAGRLVLGFHHLVFDHWSMSDVLAELGALLSDGPLDEPSDVSFLDYVSWEYSQVDRLAERRELAYWRKKLGGELPTLRLPSDRPRPVAPTRRGDQFDVEFGAPLAAAVRAFSRRESTTPFIVLLAAYKTLLMRLSGQTDVVVGTPFAGRDNVVTERIVGSFLRPVALRTILDGEPAFLEAVRRTEDTMLEAMDHQAVPFHRIVADLNLPRIAGVSPVYQTVFGVQSPAELHIGDTDIGGTYLPTQSSKADLSLLLTISPDSFVGTVEYSADLFDETTVRRLCAMYVRIIEAALENPAAPISSLPLIDPAEEHRIVHDLYAYRHPEIKYRTVAEPFEEWAERTPDATALVAGDDTVTYRELNERANRLAHRLLEHPVAPGDKVGLLIERGIPMVVAVLAAAKAGRSYVPLDTDLPPDRLRFMILDSRPALVITDAASAGRLPAEAPSVIVLDSFDGSAHSLHNPAVPTHSADALYLLYTSGTTGRPNAVSYPTSGVLANILWLQSRYPFAPGDASLFKTSYGFDVSAWEIFWPLAFGARVVIARPGGQREPEYLHDLVVRHGVTMAFFVPSLLPAFINAVRTGEGPTLRWLFCGGEPVSPRLRDLFYDNLAATLVNCCGPTEAGSVVDVALPRDPGNPRVPLGEPASNFRVYVLDQNLQVLPVGVPGEMFVGAEVGLALGYHGKAALTAERFVPDPFGPPGARMYRTGDLCRHTDQDLIEHLGRIGRQVKIRGLRVELAEIEAVIEEHPRIAQAAVVLHGGGLLGAAVVPAAGASVPPAEVVSYLRSMLPPHMIPARVVELESLPVNINGKVDARAIESLISRHGAAGTVGGRAPENPVEAKLAELFREVLRVQAVAATDSFFELGGHSILVFRLAARCAEVFGVKPSVNDIFGAPTVRELAALIGHESTGDEPLLHLAGERGKPALVLVHAASGAVVPFHAVARHLADHFDVYGLQTPPGDRAPLSIAQLAERHAAAVRAAGLAPVALVGWSMGGCVALELARRWRSEGRDTQVILLDTWLPPELIDPDERAAVAAGLRAVDLGVPAEELATLTAADRRHLQDTFDRNRDAFVAYRPEPFNFPATLLAATDPYPSPEVVFPPGYLDGDRGFGRVLPAITTRDVPGDHLSVLAQERAEALAATIRAIAG